MKRGRKDAPDSANKDLRAFLTLFLVGFNLPTKYYLSFRPSDRIMDVYRTIHPPQWSAVDSMELESFADLLERRYDLSLASIWRDDLTLGEVFRRSRPE